MWYLMEAVANQREREIAARTRAPLFTEGSVSPRRWREGRAESGKVRLPALSLGKWRHWAAKPNQVHCSRAASLAGGC